MNRTGFITELAATMLKGFRVAAANIVDPCRFPGKTRPDAVGALTSARTLMSILRASSSAAASAAALEDSESKRLLFALCAFRVLGGSHYRLPRNDVFFWKSIESVEKDLVVEHGVSRAGGYELDLYRIPGVSGSMELEAHPMNILNSFLMEEYRLTRPGIVIEASKGDVVIDGGGCWGDTTLYFADRVGDGGRVFVFEFDENNLEVLRRNLARNPKLAARIEIVEKALWSSSGEKLKFTAAGPGTKVGRAPEGVAIREVESLAIDDFATDIPRVDFIKMDIEGAEVPALQGAKRTIHSFAPKLAISAYHSIGELLTIPRLLGELHDHYDLYLSHATIHAEETVAFASRPGSRAAS